MEDYLYHYGVKGMKWGVRRYQNKDGSLTEIGLRKKKYDKRMQAIKRDPKLSPSDRQQMLSDTKALYKASNSNSKLQKKYKEEYLQKGYSEDEATIAAYRKATTQKMLIGVASLSIGAAVSYVAYKQYKERVDTYVKSGTVLQNIAGDNNNVRDVFYASKDKRDKIKYKGMYGKQILNTPGNKSVFKKKLTVNDKIKIASNNSGYKAFKELYDKDSEFKDNFKNTVDTWSSSISPFSPQHEVFRKAKKSLDKGKMDRNMYDAFNIALVDHYTDSSVNNAKKFYDQLKKLGYGGVKDINDTKYSGYNSKNPMILFDVKRSIGDVKINEIDKKNINEAYDIAMKLLELETVGKTTLNAAGYGVMGLGIGTTSILLGNYTMQQHNERVINDYRKEHPNTKLTNKEILNNAKKH